MKSGPRPAPSPACSSGSQISARRSAPALVPRPSTFLYRGRPAPPLALTDSPQLPPAAPCARVRVNHEACSRRRLRNQQARHRADGDGAVSEHKLHVCASRTRLPLGRRCAHLGEATRRFRRPVGGCWRVDETAADLGGRWAYCFCGRSPGTVRWWTCTFPNGATRPPPAPSSVGHRRDQRQASARRHRQGGLPPTRAADLSVRRAPLVQVSEQRAGARPRPSQAAAPPDARLQATDLRRRLQAATPSSRTCATASRRSPTECRVRCAWQRLAARSSVIWQYHVPRPTRWAAPHAGCPLSATEPGSAWGFPGSGAFRTSHIRVAEPCTVWTDDHPAVIAHPTVWTSRRR